MSMKFAYLDQDGWVRQWQPYGEPAEIEGLTADLLPDGIVARTNMRKVDGVYVDQNPGPPPNSFAELTEVDGILQWTVLISLDDCRARKVAEINAAWDAANASYFTYAGKQISVTPADLVNFMGTNGYVALMGDFPPDFPGGWKCIDDTYVAIPDVATWKEVYTAFATQGTANFNLAQDLKGRVAASDITFAELDAINWPE